MGANAPTLFSEEGHLPPPSIGCMYWSNVLYVLDYLFLSHSTVKVKSECACVCVCVCVCVSVYLCVTPKLEKLKMVGHKGKLCSCNEPTIRGGTYL